MLFRLRDHFLRTLADYRGQRRRRTRRTAVHVRLRVPGVRGGAVVSCGLASAKGFTAAMRRADRARQRQLALAFLERHGAPPVASWLGPYPQRVRAAPIGVQDAVARRLHLLLTEALDA